MSSFNESNNKKIKHIPSLPSSLLRKTTKIDTTLLPLKKQIKSSSTSLPIQSSSQCLSRSNSISTLIFSDEAASLPCTSGANPTGDAVFTSSLLKKSGRISKHSFDNLNSIQHNMKLISKINSISSLNDKNLDKFTSCNNNLITNSFDNSNICINYNTSNNNCFLNPLHQSQQQQASQQPTSLIADSGGSNDLKVGDDSTTGSHLDTLGSVKSLKFNNGDSSLFWDSLHKTGASSLRNTVSSSNLSSASLNFHPDPSKYHFSFTQPSSINQPPNNSQSSSQQQSQQQTQQNSTAAKHDEPQQLAIFRKNSLPHNSNLTNNNSIINNNAKNSISEKNENIKNNNNHLNNHSVLTDFRDENPSSIKEMKNSAINNNDVNHSVVKSSKISNDLEVQPKQQSPPTQQTHQAQQLLHHNGSSDKPTTKWPMVASPHQVMLLYMNKLTPYEHHEIYKYPQIYFIGANAKKRSGIGPNNSDYDNEQGSYIHIPHDHVAYRYEVLKVIGKGSFGQVVKAYDHKTREHVALKMVRNEKRFHRQAQEEIRILQHLKKQDKENTMNIIHMYDYFVFRNHMCITFELLHINLYELIKKNKFQGFSLQLVRKFAHSLLQCLDALSKFKIIHCDLKPENILLKQQGRSGIKVSYFILYFNIIFWWNLNAKLHV